MKQLRTLKPISGLDWLGLAWIYLRTLTTRAPSSANNLAIVDASAIVHHGKEDGSCQEKETEHPQHDPIQRMGKNLKKKRLLKIVSLTEAAPSTAPGFLLPYAHPLSDSGSLPLPSPQPLALQSARGRMQRGPGSCHVKTYQQVATEYL